MIFALTNCKHKLLRFFLEEKFSLCKKGLYSGIALICEIIPKQCLISF